MKIIHSLTWRKYQTNEGMKINFDCLLERKSVLHYLFIHSALSVTMYSYRILIGFHSDNSKETNQRTHGRA